MGSIKGSPAARPNEPKSGAGDGGAKSNHRRAEGPPFVTGAQIGDTESGLHLEIGCCSPLHQRDTHRRGAVRGVAMMERRE